MAEKKTDFFSEARALKLTPEQEAEYLARANNIVSGCGLTAEFLGDAMQTGVVGDRAAYTRVINLTGQFPGYPTLAELSAEICNTLPITRVHSKQQKSLHNFPSSSP